MSDFTAKMHQIRFPLGSAYSALQTLAVFKGPTSKGRGRKREGKRRGKGRGG